MSLLRAVAGLRWRARPLLAWSVTAALALLTGAVVHALVARAEAERAAYGTTTPVLTATRSLPAGHVLTPGDVVVEERPVGFVPDGALAGGGVGRTLVAAVRRGEPVVDTRLAPAGLSPLAALVPSGRRAVALPADAPAPALAPGDVVDLVAASDAGGLGASVVARGATVLAAGDDGVTVAVTDAELPAVVVAVLRGAVVPALAGA